jgi:hypothetical protein
MPDAAEHYPPNEVRYPLSDQARLAIEDRYSYHPPKNDQPARYSRIREQVKALALTISTCTPPGRERAEALTNLDYVMFNANAAIARGEAEPQPRAVRPENRNYEPRDSVAGD